MVKYCLFPTRLILASQKAFFQNTGSAVCTFFLRSYSFRRGLCVTTVSTPSVVWNYCLWIEEVIPQWSYSRQALSALHFTGKILLNIQQEDSLRMIGKLEQSEAGTWFNIYSFVFHKGINHHILFWHYFWVNLKIHTIVFLQLFLFNKTESFCAHWMLI